MSDLVVGGADAPHRACFPLSHGGQRFDDRRVISGTIFVIRNGLRWRDARLREGPPKKIYNRFIRWSRLGVSTQPSLVFLQRLGSPSS